MKLKCAKTAAFSILMLFSMLMATACGNLFGRKNDNKITVNFSAVIPEEYKASENNLRSATPDFGSLIFDVSASSSSYSENVTLTGSTKDFKLPLEEGDWTISVQVYSFDENNNRNAAVLMTGSTDISVSVDLSKNSVFKVPLYLSTTFAEGTGSVDLKVKVESDSGINYAKWQLGDELSGRLDYSTLTEASVTTDCDTGKQSLSILFYNSDDYLVYSINSILLVYSENTTNTWRAEEEIENGAAAGDALLITKEMVKAYETSTFFVGPNTGDEEGTYTKPFKNLKKALNRIIQINDGSAAYKVYICEAEGEDTPLDENAKTITISTAAALKLKLEAFDKTKADNEFDLALNFNDCAAGSSVSVKNLTMKKRIESNSAAISLIDCTGPEVAVNKDATVDIKGDVDIDALYLGSTTDTAAGNQIVLNVNGSIAGSKIGVRTLKQLNYDNPSFIFTKNFSDYNDEDLIKDIFTSVEPQAYAIGKINGEAAIGLSLLEFYPEIINNVLFELEAAEDSGITITYDTTKNANAYVVAKEELENQCLYLFAYSADGKKTPISESLQWKDIVVTCDGSTNGINTILTTQENKIQFNEGATIPAGKYEIYGEVYYAVQKAHTGGTVYLEIK